MMMILKVMMMMVVVMVLWNQRFEQCHMDRGQVVSTKLHQASYDDWVDIIIAKPEESIDNFLSFSAAISVTVAQNLMVLHFQLLSIM